MNAKRLCAVVLCGLIGAGLVGMAMGNSAVEGEPGMMASPQTIVLAKVTQLTVHTNIPASTVAGETVALNGVAPVGLGADSLGHLVARFDVVDLGLEAGEVELELTGEYVDGGGFAAVDVVRVK